MKSLFWKIYLFFIPFNRLLRLPYIGDKLQLPELMFFPWLFSSLKDVRGEFKENRWFITDIAVLAWVLVMFLPVVANGWSVNLIYEIAGTFYLAIVYFLIRWNSTPGFIDMAVKLLVMSGFVSAAVGIAGWILMVLSGIENAMGIARYYPYLGNVVQLKAFANSPNMLAGFLMISILLQTGRMWNIKTGGRKEWGIMLILCIAFLLTLSKAIVPLSAGLYFFAVVRLKHLKKCSFLCRPFVVAVTLLLIMVFYLASTHFYVARVDTVQQIEEFRPENYRKTGNVITFHFENDDYVLIPTNYMINKKAALEAFIRSEGWGVGGGNFNRFVAGLKKEGLYPSHLPDYAPHSSLTGSLAEHGITGFIVFVFFAFSMGTVARKNLIKEESGLSVAITATLIAIAISTFATDIMNFRHFWWVFGLNAAVYKR